MKIGRLGTDTSRSVLDVTRSEKGLILRALHTMVDQHDAAEEPYDAAADGFILSNMIRALQKDEEKQGG